MKLLMLEYRWVHELFVTHNCQADCGRSPAVDADWCFHVYTLEKQATLLARGWVFLLMHASFCFKMLLLLFGAAAGSQQAAG
jgi:hypothetical protein